MSILSWFEDIAQNVSFMKFLFYVFMFIYFIVSENETIEDWKLYRLEKLEKQRN